MLIMLKHVDPKIKEYNNNDNNQFS